MKDFDGYMRPLEFPVPHNIHAVYCDNILYGVTPPWVEYYHMHAPPSGQLWEFDNHIEIIWDHVLDKMVVRTCKHLQIFSNPSTDDSGHKGETRRTWGYNNLIRHLTWHPHAEQSGYMENIGTMYTKSTRVGLHLEAIRAHIIHSNDNEDVIFEVIMCRRFLELRYLLMTWTTTTPTMSHI